MSTDYPAGPDTDPRQEHRWPPRSRTRRTRPGGATLGVLATAAAVLAALLVHPVGAAAEITADEGAIGGPSTQLLEINLASSNRLLTVHGNSTSQGGPVDVYSRVATSGGLAQPNQVWQFMPDNGVDDVFQGSWGQLKNVNSGMCLNVPGGTTQEFQQLIQWPCVGSDNEEFRAVQTGPKTFGLAARHASDVYVGVNVPWCLAEDNTPAMTRASYANSCTDWTIQRIGGEKITLPNNKTQSEVIDSDNAANNWGVQAHTEAANSTSQTQTWYIQRVGNRSVHVMYPPTVIPGLSYNPDAGWENAPVYRLVSVRGNDWANATCLEATGGQPATGASVETYGCDPNAMDQPNQEWILAGYDHVGGASSTATSIVTGIGSGAFVMFNAAMLDPARTTQNYPVLSISSTIAAFNGSSLTMQDQGAMAIPANSQVWRLSRILPPTTGGGGGGGGSEPPHCVGFGCLVGLGG